jgi:tyrosinase
MRDNPDAAPHYAPESESPPGHNLDDQIRPWSRKVKDALDISKLNYSYEAEPLEFVEISPLKRNPFWAD